PLRRRPVRRQNRRPPGNHLHDFDDQPRATRLGALDRHRHRRPEDQRFRQFHEEPRRVELGHLQAGRLIRLPGGLSQPNSPESDPWLRDLEFWRVRRRRAWRITMRYAPAAGLLLWLLSGIWECGVNRSFAAELKAGVARVDLTPPLELKSPLGGYG